MKEIFTVLLALIGVILLIWVTCKLARWLNNRIFTGQNGIVGGKRLLTAVERLPLSNDKFLVAVRAGSRLLLIGVSPQHTELICELDSEEAEKLYNTGGNGDGGESDFLSALRKVTAEKFHPVGNSRNSSEKDGNDHEQ